MAGAPSTGGRLGGTGGIGAVPVYGAPDPVGGRPSADGGGAGGPGNVPMPLYGASPAPDAGSED
jgi:hypothetical protein